MENNDNEEYKKRMKELIDKVEQNKDKDTPEDKQRILEEKERLLQTAKSRIHPYYRSNLIIMVFIYTIRDYYRRRADSTEKDQFQEEIDELYKLIYEELKKIKQFTQFSDISDISKKGDKLDKKRILNNMTRVLGLENIYRDFYKNYNISDVIRTDKYTKEILWCVLTVVVCIILIILAFYGFLKPPFT